MVAFDVHLGRAKRRRRAVGDPQQLLHGLLDLLLVAVGEWLHPAAAFEDLEAAKVDLDGDGRDAIRFVGHDDVPMPSRGFEDQVVASLGGDAGDRCGAARLRSAPRTRAHRDQGSWPSPSGCPAATSPGYVVDPGAVSSAVLRGASAASELHGAQQYEADVQESGDLGACADAGSAGGWGTRQNVLGVRGGVG